MTLCETKPIPFLLSRHGAASMTLRVCVSGEGRGGTLPDTGLEAPGEAGRRLEAR